MEGEDTIQQIQHLACHYVALLPVREDSFTLPRLLSIMLATRNNPVLSLKWASANDFTFLSKVLGWSKDSGDVSFPGTELARITLQLCAQLLEFSCVVRSLGVHCKVFIHTIAKLLPESKGDPVMADFLYSILLSFAKDPFMRNHLLRRPEIQALMNVEVSDVPLDSIHTKIQLVQRLLRQSFFIDLRTDDDIFATAPFLCKLPVPTSSGRDTMGDIFLFMYFRKLALYAENYAAAFWSRLPLAADLDVLLPSDGKRRIQLDFLTDSEEDRDTETSHWNPLLVYNGALMTTEEITRSPDDNLWHCVFSLDPSSTKELPVLLDRTVPTQGFYIVMEGSQLESNTWIALGGVRIF